MNDQIQKINFYPILFNMLFSSLQLECEEISEDDFMNDLNIFFNTLYETSDTKKAFDQVYQLISRKREEYENKIQHNQQINHTQLNEICKLEHKIAIIKKLNRNNQL